MFVCVCVGMLGCVRACACVCVCAHVRERACRGCMLCARVVRAFSE